jgi:hypothetical protein
MKNLLLLLSAVAVVSCGSNNNNQVNSGAGKSASGSEGIETPSTVINFEGSYDIRRDAPNDNCPASINITRGCNGYILSSNTNMKEDFCNVNKGARTEDRNPPNPDRNPPNPDRNPPNPDSGRNIVVTQQANQLKAVVRIGQIVYTNSLTLDKGTYLTKVTDYKSRSNARCFFEKR